MKLTHTHIRTSSEALQFTEIGTMPKTMEHLLSEQQQQQQQQQQLSFIQTLTFNCFNSKTCSTSS